MNTFSILGAAVALAMTAGCSTTATRAQMRSAGFADADPTAATLSLQPQSVDPAKDVVNLNVERELTIGMIVEVHAAPRTLEVTHAGMMYVRREPRGQDIANAVRAGRPPAGGWIVVEALGGGQLVSQTAVSDTGIDIAEGVQGDVVIPDRIFLVSFPTPRYVDTVVLISTLTGQSLRLDVRRVMDEFCTANPGAAPCRGR